MHPAAPPETPTLVHEYSEPILLVYGGDAVKVTCKSDVPSTDLLTHIVWQLLAEERTHKWDGNDNNEQPDWVTIDNIYGR